MSDLFNDEIIDERRAAREQWLVEHMRLESDVMTDDTGEYILVDGEEDFEKVYLPNEITDDTQ